LHAIILMQQIMQRRTLTREEAMSITERELIADALINLAQEIGELRASTATAIESLSDKMLPQTSNEGINAIMQDAVESWAYTWYDAMQGGIAIDALNSDDVKMQLMSVALESVLDEKLNAN